MILLKQILVTTDFSDASGVALDYGRTFARTFGASPHLLHVMAVRRPEHEFVVPDAPDPTANQEAGDLS